jgi:hypothetical protein
MASNGLKYGMITIGTIGVGWAVMKGTVPSKEKMMEVNTEYLYPTTRTS